MLFTSIETFMEIEMRVGTVVSAQPNIKARKPAYVMEVDFGDSIGVKTASAQITEEYTCEGIEGTQVVAVTNFPTRNIAGVISEMLVLAVVEGSGRTVLLRPDKLVNNGCRVL